MCVCVVAVGKSKCLLAIVASLVYRVAQETKTPPNSLTICKENCECEVSMHALHNNLILYVARLMTVLQG